MDRSNRQEAIELWLRSLDYGKLVQVQLRSGFAAIEGIAHWIEETNWLPEEYDSEFPYPRILPGRCVPSAIDLN